MSIEYMIYATEILQPIIKHVSPAKYIACEIIKVILEYNF